jgi:hypothetical protein
VAQSASEFEAYVRCDGVNERRTKKDAIVTPRPDPEMD